MDMDMEMDRKRKLDTEKIRGSSIMDQDLKVLLPPEIITEILCRLPADSAIGCRCICKQWRSLISHPSFRDAHTCQVISSSYLIPNSCTSSSGLFLCAQEDKHSYKLEVIEYNGDGGVLSFKPSKPITDNPFPFLCQTWGSLNISSCNGLVFMGSDKPNINTFVCNPFTREYVHLRTPTPSMAYGFGYLPSTNEYKVVSIYYDYNDKVNKNKGKVGVYTLGSGKWRNKGEIPFWINNTPFYLGAFANGAIHWFTDNQEIVSFDLADEKLKVVVPLLRPPSPNYVDQYGVLGGCLCVATKCGSYKDIWILNVRTTNNFKEEFSWNKKFSIPWNASTWGITPQVVTKSGKIVSCIDGSFGCSIVCYDPKTEALLYGNMYFTSGGKLITYTRSFVSLKELGEEDVRHWGSTFVAHADETLAEQQQ